MTERFKPLYDRVLIKRDHADEVTPGGLVVPVTAQKEAQTGFVLEAGPGRRWESGAIEPLYVKLGDRVAFNKYAGSEIKIDGEDYLIMREEEILGVFPPLEGGIG